ncbi:hypothetical protein FL966_05025 [Caproiciproducens galactitolivorans]|uniref:Uncharacterized protein n=1 Tax=Caproiciproducens galactitolivorans TaxID=642589 RepID=A0A4Z0YCY3_9FIRM|nr:hypothetical protein [Caproiciproducens galactitolivorans]QEY34463.1 hypothetical protein FL966_05025 [Caproiciproducens galactitolivorans]TGJ77758.1 hypothetical protein CAGA_01560 [Caproiciproducens galactitolivorans]
MNIEVYIEKSSQLKSLDILKGFRRLIQKHHLENKVSLSASLCTGDFTNSGVPVKIGEYLTGYVSKDNLENVFGTYILQPINL